MNEKKEYYSYRSGTKKKNISIGDLCYLLKSLYEKFKRKGYFRIEFGIYDYNHYYEGKKGIPMEEDIILTFPGRKIWPINKMFAFYDEVTCFDLFEYFYIHVRSNFSRWSNSEDDYSDARDGFRVEVNKILSLYKDGKYELMPNGEIYLQIKDELKNIVLNRPKSKDNESINNRVDHANHKYHHHSSTIEDKKDAIKNLADVLEFLRHEVKLHLLSKDESRLFEIANTFSFRHHNKNQRTDYDEDVWLEWIFYCYHNTINTLIKITEKNQ